MKRLPLYLFRRFAPRGSALLIVMVLIMALGLALTSLTSFTSEQRTANARMQLYEEELTAWSKDDLLTRLDLAFSRDQAEKIYVQDRMRESARELWAWLEEGAHFYVCGDGARMAKDVDAELHRIAESVGGKTPEDAAAYVEAMKKEKRYKKDVY